MSWAGPAETKESWPGPTLGGALVALTLGGTGEEQAREQALEGAGEEQALEGAGAGLQLIPSYATNKLRGT